MTQRSSRRRPTGGTYRLLRRSGLGLAVLLLCLLAGGAMASAAGDLTVAISSLDTEGYPQASVVVQLGGQASSDLQSLSKDAVTAQVDGADVTIDSVEAAGAGVALPVQTVLLIDQSGSMKGDAITAAAAAATSFIDAMREGDTASVQAFNDGFATLQAFTSDKDALKKSLTGLAPANETALYDALAKAVASFGTASSGTARYVILLSDGGDTISTTTLEALLATARSNRIPIFAVGLKTKEFDSAPLTSIAEASGGRYLETPDPKALTSLYQTLSKELHNQFKISLTLPAATASSGAIGDLVIKVSAGGQTAQAERGFFFPTTTTTTAQTVVTTGETVTTLAPAGQVAEESAVHKFLRWGPSVFILGALVFILLLAMLWALSGVIFPRRDVLAEYGGLIDRKAALSPLDLDEDSGRPGALDQMGKRLVAIHGYGDALQRMIDDAAMKVKASEFAIMHLIAIVVLAVICVALSAPVVVTVIVVIVVMVLPVLWLSTKGTARRNAFNEQVPNTLTLLSGSLKAGQGFEQALNVVAREAPEPTASEFQRVLAQLRLGVPPEDALRSVADHMRSEAFDWAVMSTIIQRQVGGNLAEIYDSTAFTLRERAKLRRTIKTLTAEGRLSAIILIALPFLVGIMILIVNRGYLGPLFQERMGIAMLLVAAVLMIVGVIWMRKIIQLDKK